MLTLYTSYDLTVLSQQINHNLNKDIANNLAIDNIFNPSTIIVPSRGIGHWLTLQIARQQGIAMRLDLQLTSSFMWNIAKKVLGDIADQSFFNKDALTWRLYLWLSKSQNLVKTPELKHYLTDADVCKRWILASKIADSFDQYLLYRADVLAVWEQGNLTGNLGGDESWQALLWQEVTDSNKNHRAHLFDDVLLKLKQANINYDLPQRISVFAPSNMPLQQLAILQAVSQHVAVDMYVLSPCAKYWGDICVRPQIYSGQLNIDEDWYWQIGHPLLASLGKCGRDFFDYLAQITADVGAHHIDLDEDNPIVQDSLLHTLQSDIINLKLRLPNERVVLQENDKSIQVHIAHSELREIEILHDNLLQAFIDDPTLEPGDIAVLTPNIERYAPFIDAVFAAAENSIPYSVSDLSLRTTEPLLLAFCDLLLLPKSRFVADDILSLLQHEAIASKAQITPLELKTLRAWLKDAGARWGLDGAHKTSFDLPSDNSYSLRASVDRLLLGFTTDLVFNEQHPPLIGQNMPLNMVEGSSAQILAKLMIFIEKLANWRQVLQQNTNITCWQKRLLDLLEDVINDDIATADVTNLARSAILKVTSKDTLNNEDVELSYDLMHLLMQNELERTVSELSFIRGKVTFGTMIPLRSIPFRMICVLGLDDGSMPRQNNVPSFDLVNKYPRAGDRIRRFEDRYLFLETLMCARDILYLSYVGRDIKTCDLIAPSIVLNEVSEACDLTATTFNGKKISSKITYLHSLQPFSAVNFAHDNPSSFNNMWYEASVALNGERTQLPVFYVAQNIDNIKNNQQVAIDYPKQITPDELIRTLTNPIKFYLQNILGINIDKLDYLLAKDEPFVLENSAKLHELALKTVNLNWDENIQEQLAKNCGYLPSSQIGQIMWRDNYLSVTNLANNLQNHDYFDASSKQNINIDVTIGDIRICGDLPKLYAGKYVSHSFYNFYGNNLTAFWLNHLLLNCEHEVTSYLFGLEQNWQAVPLKNSAEYLALWLDVYKLAHNQPLPIFSKISYNFARSVIKNKTAKTPKDEQEFLAKAYKEWDENTDKWFNLAFKGTNPINSQFEQLAHNLYVPALSFIKVS